VNRKLLVGIAFIMVGIIGIAYAGYYISSTAVKMTVAQYVLTLTSPNANQNVTMHQIVTFTAKLTKDGVPVVGAAIDLLKNGFVVSPPGGNTTIAGGTCTFAYNITDLQGTALNFTARYWVP
jgi:hypothetical protein